MEELSVTENRLLSLPESIGKLKNLKLLNADANFLINLPHSIGGCKELRVLTLTDNELVELPDELSNLTQLQVLNVMENYLPCLPISFTNLPNLKALWFSRLQNKPMMQLTCEWDGTKQVLSNWMFPQDKFKLNGESSNMEAGNLAKHQRKQSKSEIFLHNFRQTLDGQMVSQRRNSSSGVNTTELRFEDSIRLSKAKKSNEKDDVV